MGSKKEKGNRTFLPEARWSIDPPLSDRTEAVNISGADCCHADGGTLTSGLLAGDEASSGRYAHFFTLKEHTIIPGPIISLLPPELDGETMNETDVEGVAYADGAYYLIGSHGLTKKRAEFQRSRFFTYRVPIDRATGLPAFAFDGNTPPPQVERTDKLRAVIAHKSPLKKHAEEPLDKRGVNIEGLAVHNGRLFVGFRGPAKEGKAYVMRVGIDAVFGSDEVEAKVFELALGKGVGVRDLATVSDGLLVLSGPSADEIGPAHLFFWDGRSEETDQLATLGGLPEEAKPEVVLVLGEEADAYRVLIFSDGVADGAPSEYRVPKAG